MRSESGGGGTTTSPLREAAVRAGLSARLGDLVERYAPSDGAPVWPGAAPAPAVVACDLDRTLMYSTAAIGLASGGPPDALVTAEIYEGAPLSFWTSAADAMLAVLAREAVFVPTTTRTRAQYGRVTFPDGPPRYAVTSNGGHLLVDGEPDAAWSAHVAEVLAARCARLDEVVARLAEVDTTDWLLKRRVAEDLFAYLVVDRPAMPADYVADLSAWCAERGWRVSVQGRKVYAVPTPLSKAAAVTEVASRLGSTGFAAAGDSLLDAELLTAATLAIRPRHGELDDAGWDAPHLVVTRERGIAAGEEIVARLLAAVLAR